MIPKRKVLSPYTNKRDTIRPSHAKNDKTVTTITAGGGNPNSLILYCPTARSRVKWDFPGYPKLAHARAQDKVYFTGYKERIDVQAQTFFIWRRIVFWTYNQIDAAIGPTKGGGGNNNFGHLTRQMTPIQNTRVLRNLVFQGEDGIDFTAQTLHLAPLNHSRIDVQMDKSWNMNPIGANAYKMQSRKHFFRGGKIEYSDSEVGGAVFSSPWSSPCRKSKGNMYILDIFSDGGFHDSNQEVGKIQCEGKVYWSES